MAPTGKVAYNVRGTTIHAAFHIPANQPLQDYKPLSFDVLNTYRMKYMELEWILGDEMSMVSNDLWRYLHLCLQELKQSKDPFGGVNIIAIGDMYQLQPVKGNYVFMDFRHNYGSMSINLWHEYFTMYELEEIMCQKNDRTFAELLKRFHVGKHTDADLSLLATRAVIRRWPIAKPYSSFLSNKKKGSRLQYYKDLQPRKLSLQLLTFHPAAVQKGSCNNYKQL